MQIHWLARQTIDLATRNMPRKFFPISIPVGTSRGLVWEITVEKDGQPLDLTGWDVLAEFVRHGDGTTVPIVGEVSGNVATVTLDAACSHIPGDLTGIMWLTHGAGDRLAIGGGRWEVMTAGTDQVVDPEGIIVDLTSLLAEVARLNAANDRAEALHADLTSGEATRVSAEKERVQAETARINAEKARVQAESDRAAAAQEARDAAQAADQAALDANQAASRATAAATAAEEGADRVNNAADALVREVLSKIAPSFTVTGAAVSCQPMEGYPLDIKAPLEPMQRVFWSQKAAVTTASATPSPTAPATWTHSLKAGKYYVPSTAAAGGYWRIDLAEALGGVTGASDTLEVDTDSGAYRLIRRTAQTVLTGKTAEDGVSGTPYVFVRNALPGAVSGAPTQLMCTHFPSVQVTTGNSVQGCSIAGTALMIRSDSLADATAATAFFASQATAGKPVTVRYALATPVTAAGQAVHCASTSGLTALNAADMALTAPDPTHPCAISIPDEVVLTKAGANMADMANVQAVSYLNASGTPVIRNGLLFPGSATYTFHADKASISGLYIYAYLMDERRQLVSEVMYVSTATLNPTHTVQVPAGQWLFIQDAKAGLTVESSASRIGSVNLQLEVGETATAYASCTTDVHSTLLPYPFAGGEVSLTDGIATERNGRFSFTDPTRWTMQTAAPRFIYQEDLPDLGDTLLCATHFGVGEDAPCRVMKTADGSKRLGVHFASGGPADLSSFLAMLGDDAPMVYYTLTEAVTYEFDPIRVSGTAGVNTLWSNLPTLTVTGGKDPMALIRSLEERITALEAG